MKKKVSLLFFSLFLLGQMTFAQREENIVPQDSKKSKCFDMSAISETCCRRGKRGPRGRRGRRGPDGSCGLGTIFLNALQMSWIDQDPVRIYPPNNAYPLFPPLGTFIYTWTLFNSEVIADISPVGAVFKIPADLDRTEPVSVVVHFLVDSSPDVAGNLARVEVVMDYQSNNTLVGVVPPASGFSDVQLSEDFIVTPALAPASNNRRQVQTAVIELDSSAIDGEWAFIGIRRVAPIDAANEFGGVLYLSMVAIEYSRLCS